MVLRTALISALFATVAARPTLDEYKQGKQDEKDAEAAAAAKEAKMAAVNKVITMLEDLSSQVLAEGEKEAALFDEFMCYCKTGFGDLEKSIAEGEAKAGELPDQIAEAEAKLKPQCKRRSSPHEGHRYIFA